MTVSSESDRLYHSRGGLARADQIFGTQCTVYVEGHEIDPFYYARVLSSVSNDGLQINIRTARDIAGQGEGKSRCLSYHAFLADSGRLRSALQDTRHIVLFILDKDVDDLLQRQIDDPHICYTAFHSVENHLVREARLRTSIAATTSADPREVTSLMPSSLGWMRECAATWRQWMFLCLASLLAGGRVRNYSRLSAINLPEIDSPADQLAFDAEKARISTAHSLNPAESEAIFAEAARLIDERFESERWDDIFKGKWYAQFASRFSEKNIGRGSFNEKAFWSSLLSSLDPTCSSSNCFRDHLKSLISTR